MESKVDLRRGRVHRLALSITAFALAPISSAFSMSVVDAHNSTLSTMQKITFKTHLGIDVAGNEYHPTGFDQNKTYAAIIHASPAGGSKEQTVGLYAQRLAEEGFVTIAFDASFQGESGGEPRYQENSIARVEDVRGAVDYLVSLPYVDENRIGVLGICAGGGYAASAAMTERRISAVGLVVPYEVAASNQKDIMVVEGASHFDMYDKPEYVDRAVAKVSAFYEANLR